LFAAADNSLGRLFEMLETRILDLPYLVDDKPSTLNVAALLNTRGRAATNLRSRYIHTSFMSLS
jgi:hypothetical protein